MVIWAEEREIAKFVPMYFRPRDHVIVVVQGHAADHTTIPTSLPDGAFRFARNTTRGGVGVFGSHTLVNEKRSELRRVAQFPDLRNRSGS